MRLETTSEDLYYGYEKRFPAGTESSDADQTSGKRGVERAMPHRPEQDDVNADDDDDYGDDDVFMDSYAVNSSSSSSQSDSCDGETRSMPHDSAMIARSTRSHESVALDVSMKSLSPSSRRTGRLLRRRLFSKSNRQLLWHGTGYRNTDQSDGGPDADSSDSSAECAFVAKEKLLNLSHEKLRSFSTDLHSNSDGLRNRVLVESTLKKFFLHEVGSPPRTSQPSTPRKRSVSSSPLTSSPTPSGPACDNSDDDTTRTLSDSIKRMRIMHSTPSSRTSLSPADDCCDEVDADVRVELDDYCMTDLAAVFHKIHCLTDLPIDAEF